MATSATIAFDAIGGGHLASQILTAMEAAATTTSSGYSRYGSDVHKQVYIYGGLDRGPTELSRGFGMAWGVGGWLLPPFLRDIGPAATRALLRTSGSRVRIAFTVPKEGACISYDALLIPASAPNPEAAYELINYVLEPQVIDAITNEIHYGNNNRAADPFVETSIRQDPSIYPTPEISARLYQQAEADPQTERTRTRTWTVVKTGT